MNHDDALIAEKLFGWKWWHGLEYDDGTTVMGNYSLLCSSESFEAWAEEFGMSRPEYAGGNRLAQNLPAYTSDAAADYSVLVKVRETWDRQHQQEFFDVLDNEWMARGYDEFSAAGYQPGDYSKSALVVLAHSKEGERA